MTEAEAVRALLAAVARRLYAAERLDTTPGEDLLPAIAATAVVALDARAASIAIHDPASDRLVFTAAAGPASAGVVGMAIDAAAGIAGYVFATGQPLAIADAASDPRFDRSVADATGYIPTTLLAAPLTDDAGPVGVLEALDHRGGSFTLRDLDVATAIAREAAVAVRQWRTRGDAAALLGESLAALLRSDDGSPPDEAAIDDLVREATLDVAETGDDRRWQLIDRIARLQEVDPDSIDLAIDWLDALLRRGDTRRSPAPRSPQRPDR